MSWKRRWNQLKNLVNIDTIQFNTSFANGNAEGRLQWNSDDGTLEYGLPGGNVNLQVGQENVVRVKNDQGSDIPNGGAVYISGASGGRPHVKLADSDTLIHISQVFGVATELISNAGFGYITTFGLVRDIDTSGFSNGDALWLSTTPGEFVSSPGDAPIRKTVVAICINAHESEGVIFVNVDIIPRLVGLPDVYNTTPNDGDILVWVAANSRFELQQP